jgi:integrase
MKKAKSGQGSLFYNNTLKRWQGQYKGKTIYQNLKEQETEKEFIRRFDKFKVEVDEDIYIKKNTTVLETIISNYIEQKFKDGKTSPASYQRNKETLQCMQRIMPDLCKMQIQKISVADINRAKPYMRDYSQSVINKMWDMLKRAFKDAYGLRIIYFNIMETDIEKPISKKETKIVHALSIDEEQRFRHALKCENSIYALVATIQIDIGARAGEVLARRISDYDEKNKRLTINNTLTVDDNYKTIIGKHTKTYSKLKQVDYGKRTIPLCDECCDIFNKIKKSPLSNMHGLFFYNYPKNQMCTVGGYNAWLRRLNQKYRICTDVDGSLTSLSSHILRHTAITRMNEHSINKEVIKYYVGHTEESKMPDTYIDVQEDFTISEMAKMEKYYLNDTDKSLL